MRYYINNFTDGMKQDRIDLILGRYRPYYKSSSPFVKDTFYEDTEISLLKIFNSVVIIFMVRLCFSSSSTNISNIDNLKSHMQDTLFIIILMLMFLMYLLMRVGTKIGKRFVVNPVFMPDLPIAIK